MEVNGKPELQQLLNMRDALESSLINSKKNRNCQIVISD